MFLVNMEFVFLVFFVYIFSLAYVWDKKLYYERGYLFLCEVSKEQKKIIERLEQERRKD